MVVKELMPTTLVPAAVLVLVATPMLVVRAAILVMRLLLVLVAAVAVAVAHLLQILASHLRVVAVLVFLVPVLAERQEQIQIQNHLAVMVDQVGQVVVTAVHLVPAHRVVITAAVAVAARLVITVVLVVAALSELFGDQVEHSLQLIQVTCNGTLHSYCGWTTV
jgi:hypothetical protein